MARLCGFDLRDLPRARAVVAAALGVRVGGEPAAGAAALESAAALGVWPLAFALARGGAGADAAAVAAWQRHRAAAATLRAVRQRLRGVLEGLRWLVLKGDLMAQALFGSPWARESGDVDALLHPEDVPEALSRLRGLGYAPTHSFAPHGNNQLSMRHPTLPVCVEVHWALEVPAWPQPPAAALLARAEAAPCGTKRPDPLSLGLVTALHFAHHQGALKPLTDLAAWWDRFGEAHGPALLAWSRALGLGGLVAWGAVSVARLSGLPCPGLDDLDSAHTPPCARALGAVTARLTRGCLAPDAPQRALLVMVKPESQRWQTALLVAAQLGLSACLDTPRLCARATARLLLLGPHRLGRRAACALDTLRPPAPWVARARAVLAT
jgi:hypothetical protein